MRKLINKIKTTVGPKAKPVPNIAPGAFVDAFPIDRPFFESVRDQFGELRQRQVDGFQVILKAWTDAGLTDPRWLAYMLATVWHECAATMQPITEYGTQKYLRGKPYWPYIGRGFVQLTWKANYQKYGIAASPEKALDPDMAAHILIDGMTKGIFTGKKLATYFNGQTDDPVNARRIINGIDRAVMISNHHHKFLVACRLCPDLFKPVLQNIS